MLTAEQKALCKFWYASMPLDRLGYLNAHGEDEATRQYAS